MTIVVRLARHSRRVGRRAVKLGAATAMFAVAGTASALPAQSWNGWKWGRSGQLVIQVGNNHSSAWNGFVTDAISDWNAAANIDFVEVAGATTGSACGQLYGTIQLCNANYGATGWVGYTYVWVSAGFIVQATVKLNEYYFAQPRYNTVAWRGAIVCQELGNALGLADSDRNFNNANLGSCMDYSKDPSGTLKTNGTLDNTDPSKSDMTNLNNIYATPAGFQIASTQGGNSYSVYGDGDDDRASFALYEFETAMDGSDSDRAAALPEPATWAMLLAGFGAVGGTMRRARRAPAAA